MTTLPARRADALVILYPGMYVLSAVLFSLTLCVMRRQAGDASKRMMSRHASDKAQFGAYLRAALTGLGVRMCAVAHTLTRVTLQRPC